MYVGCRLMAEDKNSGQEGLRVDGCHPRICVQDSHKLSLVVQCLQVAQVALCRAQASYSSRVSYWFILFLESQYERTALACELPPRLVNLIFLLCLLLVSWWLFPWLTLGLLRWRQYVPLKLWLTRWCDILQKMKLFITIAVRTPDGWTVFGFAYCRLY
jgi:hypothetical protein